MLRIVLFAFSFIVITTVFSQKDPVKYGKIDISDLQMKTYAADTTANALVLCDYGYYSSSNFSFVEVLRIKILKSEGLSWTSDELYGSEETIIEGKTYNLVEGKIEVTPMKKESIIYEKVDWDTYKIAYAFPNVKVGSVIDLKIYYKGFPQNWYFQREIPVLWSELRLEADPRIGLQKNYYGFISFEVNSEDRWVTKDVPAFKTEAYTNSLYNYIAHFQIDLTFVNLSNGYVDYATTWNTVNLTLQKNRFFGIPLQGNLFLNPIVKEIKDQTSDKLEQLKLAHEAVKKIHWNGTNSEYTSEKDLKTVYDKGYGNSADINLTLVALLQKLDISAYPAVMRNREDGLLPFFPTLNMLNDVICSAKINETTFLLDATEELLPYHLLPLRCLNNSCRVLMPDKTESVSIVPQGKEQIEYSYKLTFNPDFSLTGNVSFNLYDYAAFDFRKERESFVNDDLYMEEMEKHMLGSRIDNLLITNLDSIDAPVSGSYKMTIENPVHGTNNEIYFIPLLFHQMEKNPFVSDKRLYPVDYAYNKSLTVVSEITLPEGYEVKNVPAPLKLNLPNKAATVQYQISVVTDKIFVIYKFSLNKPLFLVDEYQSLKDFYDVIVKKQAEPIIISKKQ